MRTVALLLVLLIAAPAAAEENVLKWTKGRKVADLASYGTLAGNLGGEIAHAWQAPDRKRAFGCLALETGVLLGATELTKRVVHRTRPDGSDRKSFYSMHTGLAALYSGGWHLNVSVPLAALTGYFRSAADKHFVTDTLTGAAAGWLASKVCRGD